MVGVEYASEEWPESSECLGKHGQALANIGRTDGKGKVRIRQVRSLGLQSAALGQPCKSAPMEGHPKGTSIIILMG